MAFRDHKFGGKPSFGGRRFDRGGDRNYDKPRMYQAVCSNCGNECEVPFRPTGSKPVLCNNCFKKDDGPRRSFEGKRFGRPHNEDRRGQSNDEELRAINAKLDKILKLLEPPTDSE